MGELLRFGVSMDADLLSAFDTFLEKRKYTNRSEGLRDLVRDALVQTRWKRGKEVVTAAVCLVYNPEGPRTAAALTRLLSDHANLVLNRMQIPLDDGNWFDMLALRGKVGEIQSLADRIAATRGVDHAKIFPAVSE